MKLTLTVVTIILGTLSGISQTNKSIIFANYCNQRYNFCIDYPKDYLFPQPISTDGDGRQFIGKDAETMLSVSGSQNWDIASRSELSIGEKFDNDLHNTTESFGDITKMRVISYQKLGSNFFIISGYEKVNESGQILHKVFYQETIMKPHAFCTATLEYNESQKAIYEKVADRIFKSFK